MQPAETIINLPEYRVSEIAGAIKRAVEDNFGHVRVRGEISGFKRHSSGHCYFSLKDEQSVLGAVCWKATAAKFKFTIEDGMEVVCAGRITTYPARSQYQMVVTDIQPAGEGALMALLEKRRQMFIKEGLFDPARKKPLPFMPQTIGVITSPTGAVIRDILHRLTDRFPVHVMLWPVAVQGEGSAQQIAEAIKGFNAITSPPDLLIIARGGGSIEDLWSFNEELVVRAIAASQIPTISAVGHETDTTLADFAADIRAPTPTAAAEMAVPVRAELMLAVNDYGKRLGGAALCRVTLAGTKLDAAWRSLPKPQQLLEIATQKLDEFSERLVRGHKIGLEQRQHRLMLIAGRIDARHLLTRINNLHERMRPLHERANGAITRLQQRRAEQVESWRQRLEAISYTQTLKRGFAIVRDNAGRPLTSANAATSGSDVMLEFHDGNKAARISGDSQPQAIRKPKPPNPNQQSLL